jgi:hypothetical protein
LDLKGEEMKTRLIVLSMAMSFGLLIAGGDVSPVAPISEPVSNCSPDEVYVEEDAQLMWQDQKYTDKEDGAYKRNHSFGKAGTWKHAMNYCKRLDYAGYTDWRLPTSDELAHVHRIPGEVFRYFRGDDFWSSTPTVENKYTVVYPADGYLYNRKPSQSNYIRCVRCIAPAVQ